MIVDKIKTQLQKVNQDMIISRLNNLIKEKNNYYDSFKEIIKIKELIKKYEYQLDIIYNDKKIKINELKDKLKILSSIKNNKDNMEKEKINKFVDEFCNFNIINKNIIVRLIKEITIKEDGKINIYYRFRK